MSSGNYVGDHQCFIQVVAQEFREARQWSPLCPSLPYCRHVTTKWHSTSRHKWPPSDRCLLLVTFTWPWAPASWSPPCLAGRSAVLYKENQASYFHSGVLCCPAILYLAWQGRQGSHDEVCVGLHNLWCLHNSYVGRGGQNKQTRLLPLAYLFTAASDTETRCSLLGTWRTCSCQVSVQI